MMFSHVRTRLIQINTAIRMELPKGQLLQHKSTEIRKTLCSLTPHHYSAVYNPDYDG